MLLKYSVLKKRARSFKTVSTKKILFRIMNENVAGH